MLLVFVLNFLACLECLKSVALNVFILAFGSEDTWELSWTVWNWGRKIETNASRMRWPESEKPSLTNSFLSTFVPRVYWITSGMHGLQLTVHNLCQLRFNFPWNPVYILGSVSPQSKYSLYAIETLLPISLGHTPTDLNVAGFQLGCSPRGSISAVSLNTIRVRGSRREMEGEGATFVRNPKLVRGPL